MKKLATIDPDRCDACALDILRRLRTAGHEAYFVGGCVRDALLGRRPKDWDIATDARPEDVERLFAHTIPVGKTFGVMLVVLPEGEYEVASFRGDGEYADGRRPTEIRFTSAVEDVKRRDFTINALFYDPEEEQVIDHVGGLADLGSGILRTVGPPADRFREDHLRLLRAVRFAARNGFRLEEGTEEAMKRLAPLVKNVAGERVGQEIVRMLSEGYSRPAVDLLERTGLLAEVLPEVAALRGVQQPAQFHPEGDVWTHTVMMLKRMDALFRHSAGRDRAPSTFEGGDILIGDDEREPLAWAVLLHDIGKPETLTVADRIRFNRHDRLGAGLAAAILRRMRRPGRILEIVCELIGDHMRFMHLGEMRLATKRRFVQRPEFLLHLVLHRLDCESSHGKMDSYREGLRAWLEEQEREEVPAPLLTGRDLIREGYQPGPEMGRMLRAVEDARLEGALADRTEALCWVRDRYPRDS